MRPHERVTDGTLLGEATDTGIREGWNGDSWMTQSESGEIRRIVEGGGRHQKGALPGSWRRVCQEWGREGSQESGKRMESQRGKLGDEGSEVVVTMALPMVAVAHLP